MDLMNRVLQQARKENEANKARGVKPAKIDELVLQMMDDADFKENSELTELLFRNALVREL